MSVSTVKEFVAQKSPDIEIFELPESGGTVEEAAAVIGVDADLIAKTLSFHLKEEDILIVMSGKSRIDNKKFKEHFHVKAKMLSHDEVEEITGHPVGGLCPFGLKSDLRIFLDQSLAGAEYVYPAAGSRFFAMKVRPGAIEELTGAQWVDVCQ